MRAINFSILLLYIASFALAEDAPRVTTAVGKIKGHYLLSHNGKQYEAYEGIPYAIPPVGSRRFEPPEPINFWPGELLANKTGNSCLQRLRSPNDKGQDTIGDEDCLYLNVYAPIRKKNESLPVIFWIHGGGFQYGSGSTVGAKYLIDYQVILVTINYRLGVFGFLSTEDEIVPGNMGLKDQSLALKWVHDNIKDFGGDSSRVTLAGLSAGGVSVHYHYLSPMSKGLFHSGMSLSGTAFNSWAQMENSREKSLMLADLVVCPTKDLQDMLRCIRSRPARALLDAEEYFMPWRMNPFAPFGPVVERQGPNPFINRPPIEIIASGNAHDVPWITGVVSEEGLFPVAEFALKEKVLKEVNDNWTSIAPHLLDYYYTIPKYYHADVAKAIRNYYFSNKTINNASLTTLIHLVGDRLYAADAGKAAKFQAKFNKNPVWFYYYTHRASQSVSDALSNSTQNLGVCQGDDVNLVFENFDIVPTRTKSDFAMHKDLIKLWITVARTGKPKFGPKWLPVDGSNRKLDYLEISGPSKFKVKSDVDFGKTLFWNSIDFNENREIIKPRGTNGGKNSLPDYKIVSLFIVTTYLLRQSMNI